MARTVPPQFTRELKANDKVLIAVDFDTNFKTRKRSFSENLKESRMVVGHCLNRLQ